MNNILSSEPTLFENSSDAKVLLDCFGHYSGRYLNLYPSNWIALVHKHIDKLCDQEIINDFQRKKIYEILTKAVKEGALVCKGSTYNEALSWIDNALKLLEREQDIESLVVARGHAISLNNKVVEIDDLDLPPTAEERIKAIPDEYLRVCKPLLLNSPEVILVDPYLNPCNKYVMAVIEKMLRFVGKSSRCQSIKIWARKTDVVGHDYRHHGCINVESIEHALEDMVDKFIVNNPLEIEFILVDDKSSVDKLHDRFLLSLKGGVRLSQGFQTLPRGRKVDVSPVGCNTHDDLIGIFIDRSNDLIVKNIVKIKV